MSRWFGSAWATQRADIVKLTNDFKKRLDGLKHGEANKSWVCIKKKLLVIMHVLDAFHKHGLVSDEFAAVWEDVALWGC